MLFDKDTGLWMNGPDYISDEYDLEQLLLQDGSKQSALYGINILYDTWEVEYDSLINPPRNREAGFPRAGRYVADPAAREKIEEVVKKWIRI